MKIPVLQTALTVAIFWSVTVLILTLISAWTGFGELTLQNLSIYPWYRISVGGAFIGFLWAFFDGLIGAAIFAWLFNYIGRRMNGRKSSEITPDMSR